MSILPEHDINNRIINNDALFNNIYVINQKFDILPNDKMHYGTSIDFQDISELRSDFLNELYHFCELAETDGYIKGVWKSGIKVR